MSKNRPLDFTSSAERSQWIIANADYFTTFLLLQGKKYRDDYQSLAEAEKAAQRAAAAYPHKQVMIYAVKGVESTWVKNISSEVANAPSTDAAKGGHL